jgi:hypothetical protein
MDNVMEENLFQLQAVKYNYLWLTIWGTLHVIASCAENFVHCDNNGIGLFRII